MRFAPAAAVLSLVLAGIAAPGPEQAKKAAPAKKAPAKASAKAGAKSISKTGAKSTKRTVRRAPPRPAVTWQDRQAAITEVNDTVGAEAEVFENGAALVPFFEHLHQLGKSRQAVRILHWGDSHTASDDLGAALREPLQLRFGNGGPGFSMPGSPYLGYRRKDVGQYWNSRYWMTEGALFRRGDNRHGLGGVSLTARKAGESVLLRASGDTAEVLFLQHPGGGTFEVYIDGSLQGEVSTDGEWGPATVEIDAAPGEHQFVFRTTSSQPVRLFGTIVQNHAGVTWESMGINGAQASIITDWDPRLLATHIAKRDPSLIVLAYGTNEANSPLWDAASYKAGLTKLIGRLRGMAPQASILLVGPPDCRIRSSLALQEAVELQRKVASETRCAFWDWRGRMGGPGSMRRWVVAGLAQPDYVHFTTPGYQTVGRTLHDDLMRLFDRFVKARTEADND